MNFFLQHDQINLAPPLLPRRLIERKAELEAQINQSFANFLAELSTYKVFTIFFFLILIIGIEFSEDVMSICFLVLVGFYVLYLLKICFEISKPIKRIQTGYKILEVGVAVALFYSLRKPDDNTNVIICGAFLVLSFLIKSLISYRVHSSSTVKFMHQANKNFAILRACIFLQGALLLVQLSLGNPIPYFLVLLPTLVMAGLFGLLTARLFESIFFTYRLQIWDASTSIEEKKRGTIWIFGNLFSLALLLLSNYISFCSVLSKSADSFLGLYIVIAIWCTVSVFTLESARNGLYHIYYTLAMIWETKDEANEMEKIKYVLKISNTYYRPATGHEIKQAKSNKLTGQLAKNNEIELNDKMEQGAQCLVCCKDSPDAVFMQCGHGGVCFDCGQEIRKKQECHMCRQRIKGLLKVNTENNKGNLYEVVTTVPNIEYDL